MSVAAPTPTTPPPGSGSTLSAGRILAVIAGALLALAGAAAILGALVLGAATLAQRDDGFFMSHTERVRSATAVLEGETLDLGDASGVVDEALRELAVTARIEVDSVDGRPLFVGVARRADLDRYLDGVAHDTVVDVHDDGVVYEHHSGRDAIAPPADADVWVASSEGTSPVVEWDVESGRWAAAIVSADGAPGVVADVRVGGRIGALGWITAGVGGVGLLLLVAAGLILWAALRTPSAPAPPPPPDEPR
jgi:hypothetical protein